MLWFFCMECFVLHGRTKGIMSTSFFIHPAELMSEWCTVLLFACARKFAYNSLSFFVHLLFEKMDAQRKGIISNARMSKSLFLCSCATHVGWLWGVSSIWQAGTPPFIPPEQNVVIPICRGFIYLYCMRTEWSRRRNRDRYMFVGD